MSEENQTQLTSDDLSLLDGGQQTDDASSDSKDQVDTSAENVDANGNDAANAVDTSDADDKNISAFGDNWREDIIKNLPEEQHDKARNYLKTRNSPYDIVRGAMSADQKITELTRDRVKIPTGENDDPKDVAAYRKDRRS